MPTLRDHVRDALDAHQPSPEEARRDLEELSRKLSRRGAPRWPLALVPALAVAALVAFLLGRRGEAPRLAERAIAPVAAPAPRGVHLYLRASDEPESRALRLDLVAQGELSP